jgi:hypothetical protein
LPFTLAHPAAVLPLRKKLLLSALVVGSMAPDFHYFFYFAPDAEASHSFPNTFLYSLPMGLALLWLFHRFMKRPIISLLPESQVQKLVAFAGPFPFTPVSRLLLILGSLIAGTLTHLLWDSFTHEQGWMVLHFPALQMIVLNSSSFQRPFYNVLQHLSSILGMAVMAIWYGRWLRKTPARPLPADMEITPNQRRWAVTGMTILSLVLSLAYAWYRYTIYYRFPHFVAGFLIAMITVTFVEMALFSAWWWRARRPSTTD